MPRIEDATHFLLVLAKALGELGLAETGLGEGLQHRQFGRNVGGDGIGSKPRPRAFAFGTGKPRTRYDKRGIVVSFPDVPDKLAPCVIASPRLAPWPRRPWAWRC
jgi:hypothetical protein